MLKKILSFIIKPDVSVRLATTTVLAIMLYVEARIFDREIRIINKMIKNIDERVSLQNAAGKLQNQAMTALHALDKINSDEIKGLNKRINKLEKTEKKEA
jgi:hypothetical protein